MIHNMKTLVNIFTLAATPRANSASTRDYFKIKFTFIRFRFALHILPLYLAIITFTLALR